MKEGSGRDPAARDPGAKDPPAKDPVARDPVAKDPGPKDSGKDSGRREPVAAPRARPEPGRAACSDELVALSLGTLGPADIDRLRSKGCLPAIAAPK